jgi:catechol 2,3-dioxygenase
VAPVADAVIALRTAPGVTPIAGQPRLGLFHVAILLPDRVALGGILRHLTAGGVRPGMADHLVSEALYLRDPDGLGLEIYADRPRAQWGVSGSEPHELQMDSITLDAPGLIAGAREYDWRGMPAGAKVGHVHLSVGSLEAARDFFHAGLGMDVVVWSYPGALFMSAGGYHHHLGTNTWAAAAPVASANDARLLEWEMIVPDAEDVSSLASHLSERGMEADIGAGRLSVEDPWGTRVIVRSATP